MKLKISFLVLISLFLCACKGKEVTEAKQIIKEWVGKTIELPNIPPNYLNNSQTQDTVLHKLLFYTNSWDNFQFQQWKEYINEANLYPVEFLFYFDTKNDEELVAMLMEKDFNSKIYIDKESAINKLNNFPIKKEYQCFLLDKDNKVVLIGNPALNRRIWDLYMEILDKTKTKRRTTIVEADKLEIEIKDLQVGKKSESKFFLKNTGTFPLVIRDINTTCGCTVPKWDKQPILPGETTEIDVEIIPDYSGGFRKTVYVYCNIDNNFIPLVVKGKVRGNDNEK